MMPKTRYDERQLKDLLLQMMETELGGEKVYRTALQCAINEDLKEEWEKYLEETLSHQNVVRTTCEFLGINADEVTPSRQVVKHIGLSLVKADRKSTRLNSSHLVISYAVFCLKKKKKQRLSRATASRMSTSLRECRLR